MTDAIAISDPGFSGTFQELRRYDPDLTLNGNDFIPCSTIVLWDSWSLEDESNSAGISISLNKAGAPMPIGASTTTRTGQALLLFM